MLLFHPFGLAVLVIVWIGLTLLLARSVVAVLERVGVASEQHRRRWFWCLAAGLSVVVFVAGWLLI